MLVAALLIAGSWRDARGEDSPIPTGFPRYTVTDLGTVGGSYSVAMAISSAGQVVGGSSVPTARLNQVLDTHAFFWEGGIIRDLGGLPHYPFTVAHGVNSHRQVVGGSDIPAGGGELPGARSGSHAFLWQDGLLTDLTPEPGTFSEALGINEAGTAVGFVNSHAITWQGSRATDLGTLGGAAARARAINNKGEVVGDSATATAGATHAFLWTAGQMQDLGTLGGLNSHATALNDAGQVVGDAEVTTGQRRAFLWQDNRMQDLGTLGGQNSAAFGIDGSGRVVGASDMPATEDEQPYDEHAFLWQNGQMVDLNRLISQGSGWVLEEAAAMNDSGQIAGSGELFGEGHAFLLTPVGHD